MIDFIRKISAPLKYFDWILFLPALLLFLFGLAALYGIATSYEVPNFINFQKQIIFGVIGVALLLFFAFFDYKLLKTYSYLFYFLMALVLVAVLIFGKTLRGTTGWLSFFGLTFQPVELAKVSLIIIMAGFYSDYFRKVADLKFIFKSGIIAALMFALVFLQPDFGSAVMLFFIWFFLLLISGIKRWQLLAIALILIFSFGFLWNFVFVDYQKDRIITFVDPSHDPYGSGYHVRQAVIGVGSGQLTGRGLASGSQSQLKFIPASQTDFIFAVIAEELGFLGSALILIFYFIFFYRVIHIAKKARDDFALYLVLGASVLLFCQFFINVGMNVGILPVTGIGLPFISYGGSFLIASFILAGIIESVAMRSIKYRI